MNHRDTYTVSVVIPTLNRCHTLKRALESVYAQSRQPDEVIVVDDGSTDNTADLIQEQFPQVCFIRQDNKGVSNARNTGLGRAEGEWIAFLDSDDEWLPNKLELQFSAAGQYRDIKIIHSNEIWIRGGKRVNQMNKHAKYGGEIFLKCLPLCVISPSAVLIHHSVFQQVGVFDESLPACEDYDLWLRACARFKVHYIDEPLIYKYGGHSDQLSQKYWGMDRFRIQALEKIIKSGTLSIEDQRAAMQTLSEKISIYIQGARKRDKWQEVKKYEALARSLCEITDENAAEHKYNL